ncbi:carboxypeptidase-like regulatory domain-containing protein [Marinobacter salinisoli]|uniref:Carboxypeptidase-like regulatory domain-containing protein n=1 Tax=Marinobacter salinisoli TaxID=2769486 RepID=A0ABX7MVL4_9GAMM|nr:carboxypeptidase regulatory-like domain-containing protein [Marinobacter salinisoli]QSP95537.1 carboxypeptidase-like regulatory domain-containing protein [Marinobacter salinisoli]
MGFIRVASRDWMAWGGLVSGFSGALAIVLLLFISLGLAVPPASAAASWTSASDDVELNVSSPIRSRRSPNATVNIQVINNSQTALEAPYRLLFEDLTGGVSIQGATTSEEGIPVLDLSPWLGDALAPGATSPVISVIVVNGGSTAFSFQPSIQVQQPEQEAPLGVVITSPESLITIGHSPLTVRGTINKEDAILTVNGKEIAHSGGQFVADVALEEGHNTIVASARGAEGVQASAAISVSLDLTPPYITVESHEDGQVVRQDTITVTGLINDVVRGTVEDTQATVTVNGKEAVISNRSYSASGITLVEGENEISVKGADQVGNTSETKLVIVYEPNLGNRLIIESGNEQSMELGEFLENPLEVRMVDPDGAPVDSQPVVFRVVQGAGALENGDGEEVRALVVDTDTNGLASVPFRVGYRVGVANHKVRAQAVGERSEVVFTASAQSKPGDKLSVNSGNNQRGAVGQVLPAPFVAVVTDDGANVVEGASVQFSVIEGGGEFIDGSTTKTLLTDSDGRASVQYRLGDKLGLDAQRVTATITGPDGSPINAGFMASAFQPGDPGDTSITGVVLDNQDNPIPGVTIRIDDTNRQAVTNAEGRFEITEVPVGPVHLVADGSTASVQGEFPSLAYNLVTVAGVENPMATPIYMVKINTDNAVYAGKEDVELTLDKFPGFKLEIAAGSVTFPDGKKEGYISATAVNASKIPMAPPNGMQPQFIVTIQPAGAKFDPPARLSLPNVDGHKPGAQVEMYSFDHDLEEFVAIGLGTVSEDGSVIRSNPGVGVIKAGWHCGSQPGGSGCSYNCAECEKCDNCNCVPDPSQNDSPISNQTEGDCKTALCQGFKADPSDIPDNDVKGDCKRPGCDGANPTDIPDDSDILPKDTQCSECKEGELTSLGVTECDDGLYCTSATGDAPGPDECKDGRCLGEEIGDKTIGFGAEVNVSKYVQYVQGKVEKLKNVLGGPGSFPFEITGGFTGENFDRCCEDLKKVGSGVKFSGGINMSVYAKEISTPYTFRIPFGSDNPLVLLGLVFDLGVSGSLSASGENNPCSDEQCGPKVSGSASLSFGPKVVAQAVSSDVLRVSGGGSASGSLKADIDECNGAEFDGCAGPVQVSGQMVLAGLISTNFTYVVPNSEICLSDFDD